MKSLGKFPDRFLAEIAGQPEAMRRAAAGLQEQGEELARLRAAVARSAAVVFTGMGASYDACHVPVTLLAGRGLQAAIVNAADLLHFRLAAIAADTLLVCVSQSGESPEPAKVAETVAARKSPPTLASVTNGLGNTLARSAAIRLDIRAGEELGPSTMTFAATLVVLAAIAGADEGAEVAASELERLLARPEQEAAELADWLGERPALTLLGRGCARATAEMGALTLKEAARFPAESLEAAQFRHGPLELAGPDHAAMVFATEPRTRDLDLALATELVAAGSAVLVVSQDGEAPDAARALAIGPVPVALTPAVAILPTQLLAWRLARSRGRTPGEFTVASKVTTRE